MTIIHATSLPEYNTWSKFNSGIMHTVLVPEEKRAAEKVKIQYHLKSISDDWQTNFGKGLYLIKELGYVTNEKGKTIYYANANYKSLPTDPFIDEVKFKLCLNPLYYYSSIGRKDLSYENLLGATIEVKGVSKKRTITTKADYTTFIYNWEIAQFPDSDDNLPGKTTSNNDDFDDEDLLNFYGM